MCVELCGRTLNCSYKALCVLLPHVAGKGRSIAHAVSRWLPTAAALLRAQVRSWGICGGQSGLGAGFLRELRFPPPILIPPSVPHSSSSIIRGWYKRPISGRHTKWIQSHPTTRTNYVTGSWACSALQSLLIAMTVGSSIFWNITPCENQQKASSFMPVYYLDYYRSTLKMEVISSSET
jgi:hypothetical protein